MKTLLVAMNAKYIHMGLAVYQLRSYAEQQGFQVDVAEYTVNQNKDGIISDIYGRKPDWIGFSCYIWNIEMVKSIAETLHLILPNVSIWFGGSEVSHNAGELLEDLPYLDGVMMGEGEETFVSLLKEKERLGSNGAKGKGEETEPIDGGKGIQGIAYRDEEGIVHVNPPACLPNMDEIPFPYGEGDDVSNRIVYYESSRGCPFTCSYCLSSITKSVRFRSMDKVKEDLLYFLSKKVARVKFVDRTFNLNPVRTREIWEFIRDHDNGVTNFHFEISADLLDEEDFTLISTMRRGLMQFEIGVQSTNGKTLQAIRRNMDVNRLKQSVIRVKEGHNVHQHLDLIVGLPYEDYEGVRNSFRDVYQLKPEQIQLGFLKVLKGSPIREEVGERGIVFRKYPPYEVLSTKWLDYSDVARLKQVEEMVEIYYNSGQFEMSLSYLERFFENPFDLFVSLSKYYGLHLNRMENHSRIRRYEILFRYFEETFGEEAVPFSQLLTHDLYRRENIKNRPSFAGMEEKSVKREFYKNRENWNQYLPDYTGYEGKQVARMTHLERFFVDIFHMAQTKEILFRDTYVLFDYKDRDPLTNDAKRIRINGDFMKEA